MKFTSRVIAGHQHGRTIGYPTANLEVTDAVRQALVKEGVYTAKIKAMSGDYKGVLFYGTRSLFKDNKQVCEILLLDFVGDIYGQEITVEVVKYLRPSENVSNEADLIRLIEQDIANTNQLFNQ